MSTAINVQDKKIELLTAEAVLHHFMAIKQPLLLAINTQDYQPRILTATDDKRYLVFFSSSKQVCKNQDTPISCLAQSATDILQLAANSATDGVIFNPWGKRLTLSKQEIRHIYYKYFNLQYIGDNWQNLPLHTQDYDQLMWDGGEPYEELGLEKFIDEQNRQVVNVAWWAKEQPQVYRKPPLFMQIWLAFYGLYWLQTIFAAGLNTLYYKELDEADIILSVILSVGVFFIFKYLHLFTDWWYAREESKQKSAEAEAEEADATQRELQKQIEEQIRVQQLKQQQEQLALQELQADLYS